jgi:DNA-nicking Smr family endonuclease
MAKQRSTDRSGADLSTDTQTFRDAMRDVKPLKHTPRAAGLEKPKPRARVRKGAVSARENLDEIMPLLATVTPDDATAPPFGAGSASGVGSASESASGSGSGTAEAATIVGGELSFQRAGVRTQVMRRLRRGLYPVEDELDLHGLTQTAARERLAEFLERGRDTGARCVRIIHGKGYRSGARGPVLKTAVNLWLRRHSDVMAFVSARAIDGGTGAVYVLLRA